MMIEEINCFEALPLLSLNHVSLLVRSVWTSVRFYEDILGFCLIKRPSSFDFHGAWLFNYGIGIHLLEKESVDEYDTVNEPRPINPKDNHISFQCTDVGLVKSRLEDMGIRYATAVVEEGGIQVDQVFFHDPDGYMIEICNCDNLPVVPIPSCSCNPNYRNYKKMAANDYGVKETVMVDLRMNMMNFSF
ncbi:glyoxylase I 4-like [Actinidia eriantha]|uniref:glyoxylase I 4-like n=1 Tax=Actinidia eriantha TaxID=165200 RepID=UPI00258FE888|nr:glyoxylase I 4-like [Actinidia eriantha]